MAHQTTRKFDPRKNKWEKNREASNNIATGAAATATLMPCSRTEN